MIITLFKSRLRDNVDMEQLQRLGARMYELASGMPGFISYREFASGDGESLAIVEFASEAELLAWRNHPEHVRAQALGRTQFFAEYHIQVCAQVRSYKFVHD